jgi:hypothetical protein
VRFHIEREGHTWISERAIRAGRYPVPQMERDTRHIPDGILRTNNGDICIEVELTQKKPAELFHKMAAVMFASDPRTHHSAYAGIWYYTPDPRIKKALEAAREAHARDRHMGRRAEIVKIILLEMLRKEEILDGEECVALATSRCRNRQRQHSEAGECSLRVPQGHLSGCMTGQIPGQSHEKNASRTRFSSLSVI